MKRNGFWYRMILCAFPLLAQSGQNASPRRLITLDVAATNSKGEPVTDLTLTDIQLREDGKPQPVVFFRFAGGTSNASPLAPGEFANHAAPPPIVILLDRWNETRVMSTRSGIELDAAIQHMQSAANVYIYFLTNKGDLVSEHALPGPGENLHAAAIRHPAELRADLEHGIQKYQGFRAHDDVGARVNTTFRALGTLNAKMSALAGRKSLIWITEGIPLTYRTGQRSRTTDFTPAVQGLSELAAQSQIAIYTVDQAIDAGDSELSRTLQMFSALTGGRWYPHDDAASALAEALTDARSIYRLAYYSTAPEKDAEEHRIRLDTSRKDVHVRAREGFTLGAARLGPDQIETVRSHSQIDNPFDASEIGLRVALSRKQGTSAARFDIHVDPADVLIERNGERYQAKLDVMVAFYSEGSLKGTSPPKRMSVTYTQAQMAEVNKDGISMRLDLPVGNEIENARVIVFDPTLQALGSVTVPTKIAPP